MLYHSPNYQFLIKYFCCLCFTIVKFLGTCVSLMSNKLEFYVVKANMMNVFVITRTMPNFVHMVVIGKFITSDRQVSFKNQNNI